MPSFSNESLIQLRTCHPKLQLLFNEVIKWYDCKVIEGYRSPERQLELYDQKLTKNKIGKHNNSPSLAADVYPYPIVIPDRSKMSEQKYIQAIVRFYDFAGFVKGVASQLYIPIRWGGDWDRDNVFTDQVFNDLPHFELYL